MKGVWLGETHFTWIPINTFQ